MTCGSAQTRSYAFRLLGGRGHGRADASSVQNAELFSLTYGALVVQLVADYQDYAEVNKQLDKMCALMRHAECSVRHSR